jgi:uncharacterized membrane protein
MTLERKYEITRLEAFSDAVFAFALTLLVVSLEAPKSYAERIHVLKGFLPFAACFALLIYIYFLMGPAHWAYGEWNARQRNAFMNTIAAPPRPPAPV